MGMFDNISDYMLECPYCGKYGDIEIQTKSLECMMDTYSVHYEGESEFVKSRKEPKVHDSVGKVYGVGICTSPSCYAIKRMNELIEYGYTSGFGRSFWVKYDVKDGQIVGPAIEVSKKHTNHEDDNDTFIEVKKKFIDFLDRTSDMNQAFAKVLEQYGEYGIAVLHFSYHKEGFSIISPNELTKQL